MLNEYITKNGKKLRCGYTTGSCATACSKAGGIALLTGKEVSSVSFVTPSGVALNIEIVSTVFENDSVVCCVKKDSGDDPDITNGTLIYARVSKITENAIKIDGGIGVGRVTKPGLDQPVGNAAINSVPRKMITDILTEVSKQYNYHNGFSVEIFIPNGEELAKKTYNNRLGIIGGLSILGTSGIVEPMSESAIVDTIFAHINTRYEAGDRYLLLIPGNYGEDFISKSYNDCIPIKCSNFLGDAIDYAYNKGFKGILIIGHGGKIIKLGCGLFNTHSKFGDCRGEILATYSGLYGAGSDVMADILQCVTVDQMLEHVYKLEHKEKILEKVMERISFHTNQRVFNEMGIETIMFTEKYGIIGKTKGADAMLAKI